MLPAILIAVAAQATGALPKPDSKPIALLPRLFSNTQRPESAISRDRTRLALSTREDGVWILDLRSHQVDLRIPKGKSACTSMGWSPDGATLAIVRDGGFVELVDARTGTIKLTLRDEWTPRWWTDEQRVVFLPGTDQVLTGLNNRHLDVWSAKDGKHITRLAMRDGAELTTFTVSSSGDLAAAGSDKGDVMIWNLRLPTQPTITCKVPSARESRYILSLEFNPSGDVLAVGGGDCRVRLWKFHTSEPFQELVRCDSAWFDEAAVGAVRWSADGRRLLSLSASTIYEVCVWDVMSSALLGLYEYGVGDDRPITGWFSSDSEHVVSTLGGVVGTLDANDKVRFERVAADTECWFRSDGTVMWGLVDGYFIVRRVCDADPLVVIRSGGRNPKEPTPTDFWR